MNHGKWLIHGHTTTQHDGNIAMLLPTAYKKILENIRKELGSIEIKREYVTSNLMAQKLGVSKVENSQDILIIKNLKMTVSTAAVSYEQVLNDLKTDRVSYRGTIAELREVLREVLDYLAPDENVMASPNFHCEENQKKPTMKQKVRFILKKRNKGSTASETAEEATSIVDEGIAKLVRATYNRGSLSAHVQGEGKPEVFQIKRYLDSVLCELLEIH